MGCLQKNFLHKCAEFSSVRVFHSTEYYIQYVCVSSTYETEEAYGGTDYAGQSVGELAEELSLKRRVFGSWLGQETTHHRALGDNSRSTPIPMQY